MYVKSRSIIPGTFWKGVGEVGKGVGQEDTEERPPHFILGWEAELIVGLTALVC